jgi:hypothetical protein
MRRKYTFHAILLPTTPIASSETGKSLPPRTASLVLERLKREWKSVA